MAFLKRIGQTTELIKVEVNLISIVSSKLKITDKFSVEWERGEQLDHSNIFRFPEGAKGA